ncbi:hypothetical protein CRG98_020761 [Punica granatum]|uniref:Uncharacterized protein n=1 Tax=Punica granatum TaxID=22663 RepID=A0A2I0JRF3_PUNGR|nr:hypothetical protein CRG98_020761 [Punica granatum]
MGRGLVIGFDDTSEVAGILGVVDSLAMAIGDRRTSHWHRDLLPLSLFGEPSGSCCGYRKREGKEIRVAVARWRPPQLHTRLPVTTRGDTRASHLLQYRETVQLTFSYTGMELSAHSSEVRFNVYSFERPNNLYCAKRIGKFSLYEKF